MRKFLLFLLSSFTALNLCAQPADSTSLLPVNLPFATFNSVSKQRLDSLQAIVPLPYNEFVQQYIEIYAVRNKAMIGKMLGLAEYYFPVFEKALKAYNIPDEIKYLTIVESALDPLAISKSGAAGLWQFMPATAKGYGLNIDKFEDQRKDPVRASYAAAAYFKDAYNQLGDWLLAIAAYNCGTGDVRRAVAKAGSNDYWEIRTLLPEQTQRYVPAFIAAVYAMKCASSHQIVSQKHGYLTDTDTLVVNRPVSIPALAKVLNVQETVLVGLNPAYGHKIVNASAAHSKKIVVPVQPGDYNALYNLINETELNADTPAETEKLSFKSQDPPVKNEAAPAKLHIVSVGQNLSRIAAQYRISVEAIKEINSLKSDQLAVGQELKIPSAVPGRLPKKG